MDLHDSIAFWVCFTFYSVLLNLDLLSLIVDTFVPSTGSDKASDWSQRINLTWEQQSDWVQDVVLKSACRDTSGQTCCFDPYNQSLFTLSNCPSSWASQNATCCCWRQINPPRIVPDPRWAWPPLSGLIRRHCGTWAPLLPPLMTPHLMDTESQCDASSERFSVH